MSLIQKKWNNFTPHIKHNIYNNIIHIIERMEKMEGLKKIQKNGYLYFNVRMQNI